MKLKLSYNYENSGKPIISEIILKMKTPINILEAKLNQDSGEMIVDIPASDRQLASIIDLFGEAGVTVKELTQFIEIDRTSCTSCGACVSSCPVQAINQMPDWEVEYDDKKCIRCRICITACPFAAINLT
ncbi:MAG TPA: 4Fe-4S binding protein [Candidatus Bathyarchaeia archaeon]|nr:4Fe-4S binding protein [Candidatus Bathyarchaeia archaeon]